MAKAAIVRKYALSATGILSVNDDGVALENTETGELIQFEDLLGDFADKVMCVSTTSYAQCYDKMIKEMQSNKAFKSEKLIDFMKAHVG